MVNLDRGGRVQRFVEFIDFYDRVKIAISKNSETASRSGISDNPSLLCISNSKLTLDHFMELNSRPHEYIKQSYIRLCDTYPPRAYVLLIGTLTSLRLLTRRRAVFIILKSKAAKNFSYPLLVK